MGKFGKCKVSFIFPMKFGIVFWKKEAELICRIDKLQSFLSATDENSIWKRSQK